MFVQEPPVGVEVPRLHWSVIAVAADVVLRGAGSADAHSKRLQCQRFCKSIADKFANDLSHFSGSLWWGLLFNVVVVVGILTFQIELQLQVHTGTYYSVRLEKKSTYSAYFFSRLLVLRQRVAPLLLPGGPPGRVDDQPILGRIPLSVTMVVVFMMVMMSMMVFMTCPLCFLLHLLLSKLL